MEQQEWLLCLVYRVIIIDGVRANVENAQYLVQSTFYSVGSFSIQALNHVAIERVLLVQFDLCNLDDVHYGRGENAIGARIPQKAVSLALDFLQLSMREDRIDRSHFFCCHRI